MFDACPPRLCGPCRYQPQLRYPLLKPAAFGRIDNYLALGSDYGDSTFVWQGVEMNVNAA